MGDHVNRTAAHRRITCHVKANRIPHPSRIGVRRTLRMGLISIARDDHPVGVRRVVVGGLIQGFTPLAIHFRPFGTKNKTYCNRRPLIDGMLLIDSMSSIHRTPYIDAISWIHGTSSIHSISWVDATSRISTESLIVFSRNAAEVNSQGRKPLETGTTTIRNPNGVIVAWICDQSRARVLSGTSRN